MVFKIEFNDEDRLDLYEARDYSKISKNLLAKLDHDIIETIERLQKNPQNFQKRYRGIKIVFIKTFPYGLQYIFENETVYIQRVLHHKQFYK
jgi:plasmid stabilization system protein ParE